MNISEIKCNGVGYTLPAKKVAPIIQTMVHLFKIRNSPEKIIESLKKLENDDYYFGPRCIDDEKITTRICSGIVEYMQKTFTKQDNMSANEYTILIENKIESLVHSLDARKIDQLILEGIRDCASADHWYTFEKQWD